MSVRKGFEARTSFGARLHMALDEVAPTWRAMEERGIVSAYQRLDWVRPILEHVAASENASPLFVEVTEGASGRPVMILPLALIRRPGYRVITWFDLGLCDYAFPVVAAGIRLTPEAVAAAWAAAKRVLPRADLIRIGQIPDAIDGHANPLAALGGRPMAMQASGVPIAGDADTLLTRICRSSTRRDMDKQRRRLERTGAVAFVRAGTADEVETLFSVLVEQRRSRFAELGRFDLLARPEIQAFYKTAALEGLSTGLARLFGLRVGATWIATAYGLVNGGTFHGILLTASNAPDWRKASPGLQIVADCMRWSRSEGLTYFDFTVGDLPYKRDFGAETRPLAELATPLTATGWAIRLAELTGEGGKAWLRRNPAVYEAGRTARRALRKLGQRLPTPGRSPRNPPP